MAHTREWDETAPADNDNISDGASEIRDLKTDTRERMDVEHRTPSTGDDDFQGMHTWAIVSKTTNYTALTTDHIILVDATAGNVTITLPTAVGINGKPYIVKKTDSSSNTVIVDGDAAETIDGLTTYVLHSQFHSVEVVSNNTNWSVIREANIDVINEKTGAAGVTVDGVLLKDSEVTIDVINEKTGAAGVTVDGVLLKDIGAWIVGAASGNTAYAAKVTGDTNERFVMNADGVFTWGPGNAIQDVTLYRSAADTLKTDDDFIASTLESTIATGTAPLTVASTTKVDNLNVAELEGNAAAAFAIAAKGVTNGDTHNHDGGDGATIPTGGLSDSAVSQAKLKTSLGSVSTLSATAVNLTLPGGEYGFYPQLKNQHVSNSAIWDGGTVLGVTYTTTISLKTTDTSYYAYAQQRYVTASGEIFWIFILRDKITKIVIAMYQAPDHPCFGNGNDPELVPHPFPNLDPVNQEIIVIQGPQDDNGQYPQFVRDIKAKAKEQKKDPLEIIKAEYEIDETSTPVWSTKPITVGLEDEDVYAGKEAAVIKSSILQRPELIHKELKTKI